MRTKRLAAIVAIAVPTFAAAAFAAGNAPLRLGQSTMSQRQTFEAFYDGHKDAYLVTDVSSKAQASMLHVNYAAELKRVKGLPDQYFVQGAAAPGQLSVFGSEPGESDYNPLWDEVFVTWKPGVKPVLLVKDDQIKSLAKQGKLTMRDAGIVLNAPIVSVGK
jgi:hypothetical protein